MTGVQAARSMGIANLWFAVKRRAYSMSEFERQIYADLKSTDRVSLWVAKCMELAEFSCILTDEDIDGIAMVYKTMRKKDDPCKS